MKIKILASALTIALAAVSFTACGNDDNAASESIASESVSDDTVKEEESASQSDKEEKATIASTDSYSVYLSYFEEGIGYPQISGMSNEALQDKVNEYLKSMEASRYDTYGTSPRNYESYAEVNYCDDSVLSLTQIALFDGGTLETGSYSLTGINLNMETGEELELSEIADIDVLAEKFYSNDGVVITDAYEGASIEDFISERYIESAEDMADYIAGKSFSLDENKHAVISFSTENGIIHAYAET